ncbi:carbohydrate ABC transporter permease [Desertihabitans brevis]|uniref:Carbohydrate ABC transporter permease n=1 Tax=Desertihabitans brevis TaxID=2268447 RepID=A0A367YYV4_9ACTN|nr:carbohydrate ABC transporter permease [Desertihabitans brevis]RCK70192.1 carbohydrate ABC transporter permease [Desertihabitans brevis]
MSEQILDRTLDPVQDPPKTEPPPSARRERRRSDVLRHAGLILFGLVMLYPLVWMAVSAFKPSNLVLTDPSIIPTELTLQNFRDGWNSANQPFWVFYGNSLVVAVCCIIGNLFSCSLTAYALARLDFRAKKTYFAIVLVSVMLPMHVVVIPQYIVFSQLGLVNTFVPLILPKFLATDAFFIFLMVQFIRGIPRELDQAAWLDGAGPFRTFWFVVFPLMRPALVTTAIFTFIWTWNDFFGQLIYLTESSVFTVPVALNSLVDSQTQSGIGMLLAMSVLSLVPILAFFAFAQKYLIRGISTTGLK